MRGSILPSIVKALTRGIDRSGKRRESLGGAILPNKDSLAAWWKLLVPQLGSTDAPIQPLQYMEFTEGASATNSYINDSCTISSPNGTSIPTVSGNDLVFTAGTLWDFSIEYSDAVVGIYPFGSDVTGVIWDVSGNDRNLYIDSGMTSSETLTTQNGSDWLNQNGWTESDGNSFCHPTSIIGTSIPEGVLIPNGVNGCPAWQ